MLKSCRLLIPSVVLLTSSLTCVANADENVIPRPVIPDSSGGSGNPLNKITTFPISPPAVISASWEGIWDMDPKFSPPDPHGATGPNGVLQTVNIYFTYFDKNGTALWGPEPLWGSNVFGSVGNLCTGVATDGCSDPRAIYDPLSGRFFIVLHETRAQQSKSFLNLAVSKTSDPQTGTSADWYLYRLEITGNFEGSLTRADYPGLAADNDAVYVTYNMFTLVGGDFKNVQIIILKKADLVSGAPTLLTSLFTTNNDPNGGAALAAAFTLKPVRPIGPNSPVDVAYFVETPFYEPTKLRLWAITDPLTNPVLIEPPAEITGFDNGGRIGRLDFAPQPGGGGGLAHLSPWTQGNAFWNDGDVWFCNTAGGIDGPALVYFYKIQPNGYPNGTPTLADWGGLSGLSGEWLYQPAIGGNSRGDVCLVFTGSSPTSNPAIMYATRWAWSTGFDQPQVLKASPTFYRAPSASKRWGDYSIVAVDPVDDTFWISHEYSRDNLSARDWGTWWGHIEDPCKTFCDVASVTGVPDDGGPGTGVAWGDYDSDGDLDLYIVNDGAANKLLRNEGASAFTDVTSGPLGNGGSGTSAAWGDYDNDGDLDLYLARGNFQANKLFRNDGNDSFVDATTGPLGDAGDSRAASWVDYDNDGDLDLFVVNDGTPDLLLRNDGCGSFVNATSAPLGDMGDGSAVAWGDYDNDGDLDLYLVKLGNGILQAGANKLYRNEGSGTFTNMIFNPLTTILEDRGDGQAAIWGDYDNDGDLDLCLVNNQSTSKLFRNDGANGFVERQVIPFLDNGRGASWADYDNDGDLDLYFSNDGINQLMRNDGNEVFVDATDDILADASFNGRGVAWGDYDGDGDPDLYLVNDGPNKLFRNHSSLNNHWLHVKLSGTESNETAIGVRIRIVAGGVSQIREISGGDGFGSQGSHVAEFGLGTETIVDTVTVRWSSGETTTLISQAVDQVLAIQECPTQVPEVDSQTMSGWSETSPGSNNVTLHFAFDLLVPRNGARFEIQYREVGTSTWKLRPCSPPDASCCDGASYEATALEPCSPMGLTKYQWQARAYFVCQTPPPWDPSNQKGLAAYCLTGP